MKKVLCLLCVFVLCLPLVACDKDSHEGEAKTPSGSSAMSGRNYEEVVTVFEENGFTNIQTEPIYDLVFGWFTEDGEVEDVSVGGDVGYSSDKWLPVDTEVLIRYHTFPLEEKGDDEEEAEVVEIIEEVEATDELTELTESPETAKTVESVLTIENCSDLATLVSIKDPFDPFVGEFAAKYSGRMIEFDGNIAYMSNHEDFSTRYDILIYVGNYSETSTLGPNFQFIDVNMYDLNLEGDNIPDYIGTGDNLHIVAEVGYYDKNSGLFELEPIVTVIK